MISSGSGSGPLASHEARGPVALVQVRSPGPGPTSTSAPEPEAAQRLYYSSYTSPLLRAGWLEHLFCALSEVIEVTGSRVSAPLRNLFPARSPSCTFEDTCSDTRLSDTLRDFTTENEVSKEVVDQVLIEECETSSCIPSAVLLT